MNELPRPEPERRAARLWPRTGLFAPLLKPSRGVGGRRRWAQSWQLLTAPLLLFLAVPILVLLLRASPEQILEGLKEPQVVQAIRLSLTTTALSTLLILTAGTPVAYLLGRYEFPLKRWIDVVIDLPTVLPPSVAGVALLLTFGRRGLLGGALEAAGLPLAFTPAAVVLAQTFVAAPFYVRAAALGFGGVERELEKAAQLDGASRWQALRYIVLPLSATALVSGGVLSWARALGEFGATIIFAGNFPGRTQTMPLAIYLGFEVDLTTALTLSVILIGISTASLLLVRALLTFSSYPPTAIES